MRLFEIKQRNSRDEIRRKLQKTKTSVATKRIISNGTGNLVDQVNKMRQAFGSYNPKGVRNVKRGDEKVLRDFKKHAEDCKIIAIDTETTGLDPISDKLVGICLYTDGMDGLYIPINHVSHISGVRVKEQLNEATIKEYLEDLNNISNVKWVFHNAKFDMRVLHWQLGVDLLPYWDTSIGARLLNENEPANLKYQWNRYVNRGKEDEAMKFGELVGEGNFAFVPIEFAYKYAARDAKMTYELFRFQEPFLDGKSEPCKRQNLVKTSELFREIEMPLVSVVAGMEDRGISLDIDYADTLTAEYEEKLRGIKDKIDSILSNIKTTRAWKELPLEKKSKIDDPVNISSPTQLNIIMYDVMGYTNPLAKNKSEKRKGTGAAILKAIDTDFTKLIIEYRGMEKLISTYTRKLPLTVNTKTKKVHASFNQLGTDTGRFSSSDPNLQNIPSRNDEIRRMFVADTNVIKYLKTGNVNDLDKILIGADYSQQEPRILAFLSEDETLINAYLDGKDIYATVGSIVYKLPYEECLEFYPDGSKNAEGDRRRSEMKTVVLGIMYGRGEGSIAEQLGISKNEASNIITDFFTAFPKVEQWVNSTVEHAFSEGYVQTVYGRKRRLPDMRLQKYEFKTKDGGIVPAQIQRDYTKKLNRAYYNDKKQIINDARRYGIIIKDNTGFIAHARRQAVNSVIQGSAADVTKKAMLDISRSERLKELGYEMLITVHDEVIGTGPIENADKIGEEISRVMINAPTDRVSVPMKVDVEKMVRWAGEEV